MDYCLSVSQPVGHSLSLSLSVRFNASTRIFINTSPFLYILDFIGAKDDTTGVVQSSSQIATSNFLQTRCLSCCSTNSAEALKGKES